MAKQSFVPDNGIEEDFDFANVQKCLNCDRDECNNCLAYVKKGYKKQPFTEEELVYVCDTSLSAKEIAKIINHSRKKIQSYRSYKGIKCDRKRIVYSEEDDQYILNHTIDECVERFNKSRKSIIEKRRRLIKNGIQRQSAQNTH